MSDYMIDEVYVASFDFDRGVVEFRGDDYFRVFGEIDCDTDLIEQSFMCNKPVNATITDVSKVESSHFGKVIERCTVSGVWKVGMEGE